MFEDWQPSSWENIKNKYKSNKNKYISDSLKRQGAIDAVDRILKYGRNENGEALQISTWFRQQLRIIADNRLRHVLTTGASQISKSLGNYLVAIDDVCNGQINIGWVYASKSSMINQQPSQFQRMVNCWLVNQPSDLTISRESLARFIYGVATANFTYANSSSQEKSGGASEMKELNSFQASKMYLEEKSSWRSNIDVSPRLGASKLLSKPIRELGTPGSGTGIEKVVNTAAHNFEPGLICPHCGQLSWLHPLGNLLKSKVTLQIDKYGLHTKKMEYFNNRGEILDYWQDDNGKAIIACSNCHEDVSSFTDCEFFSRQSQQSLDTFLDELPDNQIYYPSLSLYLSPLLKVPQDPYRVSELVEEGFNPISVMIYHQNKLGIETSFNSTGISSELYEKCLSLPPWKFEKTIRIVGIDQGTDTHYLVELEINADDTSQENITNVTTIQEDEIVGYLQLRKIDFALIDNEPGRLSANELSKKSGGILALADQRDILDDFKPIKVEFGGISIDCFAISNTLFKEQIINSFDDFLIRLGCIPHRKFKKHITSIKRDIVSGRFVRSADHDDDFFFGLMFAKAGKAIYLKNRKLPTASHFVAGKLTNLKKRYR